jgi:hypothetical protein
LTGVLEANVGLGVHRRDQEQVDEPADSQQAQREEPDRAGDRAGAIMAGYVAQGVN